jgi:DNA-directed RNA polymerase
MEDTVPSKRKQSQGAAPNAIHSLDAAHLMLIVNGADFPVTTVHDSFGCLFADMPELFKLTRKTFVDLYKVNPLYSLMHDIGGDLRNVEMGTLDITLILESEYCFS